MVHRAPLEVSSVGKDLFGRLTERKCRGLLEPSPGVGPIQETAGPRQADRIAHEMIAPQVPFYVVCEVIGLTPKAREEALAKLRIRRPPGRTESHRRSRPPAEARCDRVGIPCQLPSTRVREVAAIDPVSDVFFVESARLRRARAVCRDNSGEFPCPRVIVQRHRPKSAVIARTEQPIRRPAERPFFVEMAKDSLRQTVDDRLVVCERHVARHCGKVLLAESSY